jgi:type I restriction-modification system DNA methylase subunit
LIPPDGHGNANTVRLMSELFRRKRFIYWQPDSHKSRAVSGLRLCRVKIRGSENSIFLSQSQLMSLSSFIWSVADLLRGDYKQSEYGKVILPFTVLRRMDCVLEETKRPCWPSTTPGTVRESTRALPAAESQAELLQHLPMDMKTLMGDQDHIKENLYSYIQAFSPSVRDIFERFDFFTQIDRLAKCGLLYQVTEKFTGFRPSPGDGLEHRDGHGLRGADPQVC